MSVMSIVPLFCMYLFLNHIPKQQSFFQDLLNIQAIVFQNFSPNPAALRYVVHVQRGSSVFNYALCVFMCLLWWSYMQEKVTGIGK